MKYNLRFFIRGETNKHVDLKCIANLSSRREPLKGEFIYFSDSVLSPDMEAGEIYKVLYTVILYDNEVIQGSHHNDDCVSIEVVLKKVYK